MRCIVYARIHSLISVKKALMSFASSLHYALSLSLLSLCPAALAADKAQVLV